MGEYEKAKQQFKNYKDLIPGDKRGADGILSCDLAQEWIKFPSGYIVEEMKFFNSKQSDYSPAFASGDGRVVYFTSTRESTHGKKEHGTTGEALQIYMSLLWTEKVNGVLQFLYLKKLILNTRKGLQTLQVTLAPCISHDVL